MCVFWTKKFFAEGLPFSDKNAVFTSYYLGNEYRINLEGKL